MSDVYWAARPPEELEQAIVAKLEGSARVTERASELFEVWSKAYDAFHRALGGEVSAAFVGRRGSHGQALTFATGNSRSLASAVAALVNNAPTTLTAQASNTEAKSQSAAVIATTLLEHEWMAQGLEQRANALVESAVWAGEYFLLAQWDKSAGPIVARDEQGVSIRAGGLRYEAVPAWRVLREPRAASYESSPWVAAMVRRDRHELAALYPDSKDAILSESGALDLWRPDAGLDSDDDEHVLVTYLYHRPTPALPDGLDAVLVGNTLVAASHALEPCPLVRMSAGELTGTPWGYSAWWETLAAQDMLDDGWSGLLTSLRVLGKPMVSLEVGSEMDVDRLGDDGPLAVYRAKDSAPPVALEWSKPPPGADKLMSGVVSMQRTAVGLNDFALGQPPGAQLNASAISILVAAATVQANAFQQRRVRFLRELGRVVLSLYRRHASSPITIAVVGKSQMGQLEKALTFSGEDLAGADVVEPDVANGLAATAPGRVQLLELLKANGVQVGPEDIASVLATGKLRQTMTKPQAEAQLLAWEERELREGRVPDAMFGDNIAEHMDSHLALMADPVIRTNEDALRAITEHVDMHLQVLLTTDPRMLALAGVQVPQLPAPGGPGAPAPGSPEEAVAPGPPTTSQDAESYGEMPPDVPLPEGTPEAYAGAPFDTGAVA